MRSLIDIDLLMVHSASEKTAMQQGHYVRVRVTVSKLTWLTAAACESLIVTACSL